MLVEEQDHERLPFPEVQDVMAAEPLLFGISFEGLPEGSRQLHEKLGGFQRFSVVM